METQREIIRIVPGEDIVKVHAECVKTEPQTVLLEKEICGGNNAINFANTRLGVEQNTIIDRGSTERPELTAL